MKNPKFYWIIGIFILLIPFVLNFMIQLETPLWYNDSGFKLIGEPKD